MHNLILLYDLDVSFWHQAFLMAQKYSRTLASTEINPPYVLDLDMATTLIEEARPLRLVMASTMPWLPVGLWGLRPLNPYKIATTRWSVYSTKCLATIIHSFYHSMKPSTIPNSNLRQAGPYYAGYHFGTEQVPGSTMSFSPHLPEADANRDGSSGWRFRTCWVSHSGEDEIHLTIALKKS
jgi:hypothetical protein